MPKVFVSYARDDTEIVREILTQLGRHEIAFWIDIKDIETGKEWPTEISKAIKKCKKFLLFMSRKSMISDNTKREVQIAYEHHKRIIILRLDDSETPDEFNYALAGLQWTDYLSPNWKSKIVSVLGGTQRFFREPKPSPTLPISTTKSLPRKLANAHSLMKDLESAFSTNRAYHQDECIAALLRLDDLRAVAGSHWVNPALAYNEFVPRQYMLDKIEVIQNLIQDFQNTCPPGLPSKRQLIRNEIKVLIQELNRNTDR